MSLAVRASAVLILVLVAAACSGGDTPAPTGTGPAETSAGARVEPEDVAVRLLTQLRDEDYAAAHQTLSTGQARDFAANQLDLMTRLTSANTLVREWTLAEPTFVTVDDQSKVEVTGTVTYDDGGTGGVRILMQALGLQADPWRVHEFELTRD